MIIHAAFDYGANNEAMDSFLFCYIAIKFIITSRMLCFKNEKIKRVSILCVLMRSNIYN